MASRLQSKRKADDADDFETRSPRGLSDTRPTSISWRVAEKGSINSIIHCNSRRALYVEPITWTSDQLQSLDCSFKCQRPPRDGQDNATDESERRTTASLPPEHAARWRSQLAHVSTLSSKTYTVMEILQAYDIHPQGSEDLLFQFNGRTVAQLPTDGIFTPSAALFNMAFITFHTIKELRESFLRPKKANITTLSRMRKKLQLLEPPYRAEDPYLVAVLIALAQTQRRQHQLSSQVANATTGDACSRIDRQSHPTIENKGFKVKVLAIRGYQAKYFYVYSATIPAEFLDKFDEPSRYSPCGSISVSYCPILVDDGRSLERLYWLLYADSCQGLDPALAQLK